MKKNIVVKQRDFKDCGPCCILSVLKFYGGYNSLERIRNDSYTSISGTTAFHMVETFKKYGFDAYGAELSKEYLFNNSELILPIIIHFKLKNDMYHYVVLYKILKNHVVIMDPAKGLEKITKEIFEKNFTGVVIICYPKSKIVINNKDDNYKYMIKTIIKQNNKKFKLVIALGFISIAVNIICGLYFRISLNYLKNENKFLLCLIIFLIVYILKMLLEYIINNIKNTLSKNIDYSLNKKFFDKFYYFPSEIIKSRTTGEIVTRINELNNLQTIINEYLIGMTMNIFLVISSFCLLAFVNLTLFKIVVIFLLGYLLLGIITNKKIKHHIYKNIDENTKYNEQAIEDIESFNSIKNNNLEQHRQLRMYEKISNYINSTFKLNKSVNNIELSRNLILDIMNYVIISVGIYMLMKNEIQLITFITFQTVLNYLTEPIKNILNLLFNFNFMKTSAIKIMDFLNNEQEKLDIDTTFKTGDIIVNNLSYSYDDYHKILTNLNFKINKNEHVLLKGKSGNGKSTLCKLLNRTIKTFKGNILINGIDIRDYGLQTIRNNITFLSQEEYLFNDTIKNNIITNNIYDLKKFDLVCKLCFVEDIINKKALRYETYINNGFINLSGGEKQRILLARALYKNANILILDEALSEVNINIEKKIICNINKYYKDKTVIYISHKKHDELFDNVIEIKKEFI